MSEQQFTATFTQKSLVAALTQVRKGAKVHSGENWLEHADHKYGIDYVAIIVRDYDVLLVTANQWHSDVEGAAWTFAHILRHDDNTDEGIFCVPIRVLHDYVKTFSASDAITLTYDSTQTHTILTKPERIAYNMSDPVARKLARDAERAPAVEKQVPDNLLTITSGRNKANIVGKPAADLLAWESLIVSAPAPVEAERTVTEREAIISSWTYPGSCDPIRYNDGASCPVSFARAVATVVAWDGQEAITHRKSRYRVSLAQMRAYHGLTDEADAIADAAVAAITGEEYTAPAFVAPTFVAPAFVAPALAPVTVIDPSEPYMVVWTRKNGTQMREGFSSESNAKVYGQSLHRVGIAYTIEQNAQLAPTPIRPAAPYTPRVGDTVNIVYRHENGTTTNRTVDVQRVGNGLFRGYDRTYGRVRNFEYRHLAQIVLAGKEAVA